MKHQHARLAQLRQLLESYRYPLPFSEHLKAYFKKHKQMGSRDRKEVRALSYAFFRLANAASSKDIDSIAELAAQWLDEEGKPDDFVNSAQGFDLDRIFPFMDLVSAPFHNPAFNLSFLNQPRVYIKIKQGRYAEVETELQSQGIGFYKIDENVLSFAPEVNLTDLKSYQSGYFRIQDLSSQAVSASFKALAKETWWDCCAGSGGKGLALLEDCPDVKLYASDIRESILVNLENRHRMAGNQKVNIFSADVSKPVIDRKLPQFDGIIVDAPCTGSGTWARNPENLYYFDPKTIESYRKRQNAILENVLPFLKTGKPLVYITCSVFKAENEDVISAFAATNGVEVEEQKYIEGYKQGAENMFICRMIKTA